ncbi:hypothetical protein KDD30_15705 [Photobacterium sp. GJ3]|uniref:hypothetical protein n=1 Tax=Photobacterium sp. GJ3 TaxID=2829502 RepID=UPI001B8CAF98|nr:hypothetical protein [Photobacterium sp. GJ3]QUJ67451.1 hypothetical protein KDD30_15705 [Photobacterium sp. GJ3]
MKTLILCTSLLFAAPLLADDSSLPLAESLSQGRGDILMINGVAYQQLSENLAGETRQKRSLSVNPILRKGDKLVAVNSTEGAVEITGSFLIRLEPGVHVAAFAAQHQLELVFTGDEIALLKAKEGVNLLPLLEQLEQSHQVEQVALELNQQLNEPQ